MSRTAYRLIEVVPATTHVHQQLKAGDQLSLSGPYANISCAARTR